MRNITVERRKSFVASLGTFRVFVEDSTATDMVIKGVPCRKVGELKNGDETTFELGDEATRIFVVNGEASKNYCVEMYPLPAGTGDVLLSGQCKLNPAAGNAFRFDDNDSEEAKAVRKNGTKKGALVTVVSIIVGILVGVVFGVARASLSKGIDSCTSTKSERNYTAQEMDITLSRSFKKESQLGFAARFDSTDAVVYVERVDKEEVGEYSDMTADEFAQLVVDMGGFGYGHTLKYEGDLPYIEFSEKDTNSGEMVKGFISFYKSENAFWDVQFYSLEKDFSKMRSSFVKWAKSVSFGE